MTRPKPIPEGGAIGIAAPSSNFDAEKFQAGVDCLRAMGYRLVIPDAIYDKRRYLAGADVVRARVLTELFENPQVDGIVCARGGYGAMRMLRYLDFQRISRHPKPLVGFSDSTALLDSVCRRCGFVVYHGPTVTTLADSDEMTRASFVRAISTDEILTVVGVENRVVFEGTATAPIAGGNLTVLSHLLGTPYAPVFDGHILLLEDRGEALYRIDRMVAHLKLAGCFDAISGLVLGAFTDCGPSAEIVAIFEEALADRPVPMLAGFPIGHGTRNCTIPIGEIGTLDTKHRTLQFERNTQGAWPWRQ